MQPSKQGELTVTEAILENIEHAITKTIVELDLFGLTNQNQ